MIIDLPVELWLHILTFLPQRYLRKMIGVNRTLFELAMNDMYSEVGLICDDKESKKTFRQMSHINIAERVQRLVIRPAFLSSMDEIAEEPEDNPPTCFSMFQPKRVLPHISAKLTGNKDIYSAATNALPRCENLKVMTVFLLDFAPSLQLRAFFDVLLPRIGTNLCHLVLNTTIAKLDFYSSSLIASCPSFVALDHLEINIVFSRFPLPAKAPELIRDALIPLLTPLKASLRRFALSSSEPVDLSLTLDSICKLRLSRLQQLEISIPHAEVTLSSPSTLTRIFTAHQETLEQVTIRGQTSSPTTWSSTLYIAWLKRELPSLSSLSNLRTLSIGLAHGINLPQIKLDLTSLTLLDLALSPDLISPTLDALVNNPQESRMESLKLRVQVFNPALLDTLSLRFPRLKRLVVAYHDWIPDPEKTIRIPMFARSYPRWRLSHLRITHQDGRCDEGHPARQIMEMVQAAMPSLELDDEYQCLC